MLYVYLLTRWTEEGWTGACGNGGGCGDDGLGLWTWLEDGGLRLMNGAVGCGWWTGTHEHGCGWRTVDSGSYTRPALTPFPHSSTCGNAVMNDASEGVSGGGIVSTPQDNHVNSQIPIRRQLH